MIRGVLSAATAMRAQVLNQEVIANNLANAATVAYKKDKVVFQSFHDALMYRFDRLTQTSVGGYTGGTVLHDVRVMNDTGAVETTHNPLDIALPRDLYLGIETDAGIRYTRVGNLEKRDGYLTANGYRVLGGSGPIQVETGKCYSISNGGHVLEDGEPVDKLSVFSLSDNSSLMKEGNNLFIIPSSALNIVESPDISVGTLESSTVDPVSEMVSLISSLRTYEAAQRALRAHDETLEQAVNRVGRV